MEVITKHLFSGRLLLLYNNEEMHKENTTNNFRERQSPALKVVDLSQDQSQIEFEIERQVKSIRALIQRLKPIERQKYFDGLLSHILSQPVNYHESDTYVNDSYDYCNLSVDELSLIRELSVKIHELYWVSDQNIHN